MVCAGVCVCVCLTSLCCVQIKFQFKFSAKPLEKLSANLAHIRLESSEHLMKL